MMRSHPNPPLPGRRHLRGFSSGRRGLVRAARRSLFAALAPSWRGTRESLRRAVRSALKLQHRTPAFLARLVRDARFASFVAGAFLSLSPAVSFSSPPIELSDVAAGNGGFVMNGIDAGDWAGLSGSSAGDVNGERLPALLSLESTGSKANHSTPNRPS